MITARVRVPCSTSNLGAGFDCVGIALDRWLDAAVTVVILSEAKDLLSRASNQSGTIDPSLALLAQDDN